MSALVTDCSSGLTADPDGTTGDFGGPVYSITGGNTEGKFVIDPSSGQVKKESSNYVAR